MKFIQWRDELEGYLGTMSDEERKRILSYYTEIYADKRDMGHSEEEIVREFGTPYDVARKIRSGGAEEDPPAKAVKADPPPAQSGDGKKHSYVGNVIAIVCLSAVVIFLIAIEASCFAHSFAKLVESFVRYSGLERWNEVGGAVFLLGLFVLLLPLVVKWEKKLIGKIKRRFAYFN